MSSHRGPLSQEQGQFPEQAGYALVLALYGTAFAVVVLYCLFCLVAKLWS